MEKKGDSNLVLVGTYRPENAAWIRERRLYNLPLPRCGKLAFHERIGGIVLFAEGAAPLAFRARFKEVCDKQKLAKLGYSLAEAGKSHGEAYALYELTDATTPMRLLGRKSSEVFVCSSRCPRIRIDAAFYEKPYPKTGGRSMPFLFDSLRPYVEKGLTATVFDPVQMEFVDIMKTENRKDIPFPPPKHPKFTFIDLFAGIGGFRIAMQRCGGQCVFSSEWDAAAQKTYAANFGEVPYGDITKEDTRRAIPDEFDVLCGGFPCQPFSSIGKRQGFEHPTQGTLFFHIQKILHEKRPKAFILENVPGLVTHQGGQTLQTIKDVLRNELGYTMDYKVLNSADFGVPQYRKRLYIIGFRGDLPVYVRGEDAQRGIDVAADGRTEKDNVVFKFPVGKFAKNHQGFGQFVERDAAGPSISKYLQKTYIFKADDGHPEVVDERFDRPVKTLCASYHKIQRLTGTFVRGGETGLRLLTESECKHIMGFPQNYIIPVSRTSMYHQFGNSVAVPVIDELAHQLVKTEERGLA